jgi:hypothetical protein
MAARLGDRLRWTASCAQYAFDAALWAFSWRGSAKSTLVARCLAMAAAEATIDDARPVAPRCGDDRPSDERRGEVTLRAEDRL